MPDRQKPITPEELAEIEKELEGIPALVTFSSRNFARADWAGKYGFRLLREIKRQAEEIAALTVEHACDWRVKCGHLEMDRDRLRQTLAELPGKIQCAIWHDQEGLEPFDIAIRVVSEAAQPPAPESGGGEEGNG
jgi:hypothetical protein